MGPKQLVSTKNACWRRIMMLTSELLVGDELLAGVAVGKARIVARAEKSGLVLSILDGVVRNQVMCAAVNSHAKGPLEEAAALEVVRVDERTSDLAILGIGDFIGRLITIVGWATGARVGLGASALVALAICPLLLTWGERALKLAVHEEVAHDAAGAPRETVGPSLDSRSRFLVDEDRTAPDERRPFPVVRATRAVDESAVEAGLDDGQRILGGVHEAVPCRLHVGIKIRRDGRNGVDVGCDRRCTGRPCQAVTVAVASLRVGVAAASIAVGDGMARKSAWQLNQT